MYKVLITTLILFLTGCSNAAVLLGPASSMTNGKIVEQSFSTVVSYGIKKQTGKTPFEHAVDNLEELNEKRKLGFKKD